jgi:hypothetical protein
VNKKNFILIGFALVLFGVYAVYFTDWFRPKTIHISYTNRPARGGRSFRAAQPTSPAATQLIFDLGDYYELTEIKAVPLAALKTNKLAQPVWHLVGDPSSDSITVFIYGQKIDGMNPAVEGSQAEQLQPGVTYRIFITAGKIKGQHDFHIGVAPATTATNR